MIIDQNEISKRVKRFPLSRPSMGINLSRKREFSAAEKRLAMLRTLFGFVILLSLVTGGAYLIYTLVSEYANYVERRAEDPNVKSPQDTFYPVIYKPASDK